MVVPSRATPSRSRPRRTARTGGARGGPHGEEQRAEHVGVDPERPRRRAEEHAGISGEEEAHGSADHADDELRPGQVPDLAQVFEQRHHRRQERRGREAEQGPRSHAHRRERVEVQHHVQKPEGNAQVHDEDHRTRDERDERQVVSHPHHVPVPHGVDEQRRGGDDERAAREAPEEEIDVDQNRPVRRLEHGHRLALPARAAPTEGDQRAEPDEQRRADRQERVHEDVLLRELGIVR